MGVFHAVKMNRQIFRISGSSLLTGAIIFILHITLRSVITAGPDATTMGWLYTGCLWSLDG